MTDVVRPGPIPSKPPEILFDTWGVPHIFAANANDLFRSFGWAQARSHGDTILRLYGVSRGRAAEYWGERYLGSDRFVHSNGIPERAQQWYLRQSPEFRKNLDSFAEGVNQYAQEYLSEIDPALRQVLPITAADVLAHVQRTVHFGLMPTRIHEGFQDFSLLAPRGSNGWAIGPSHSKGGKAMLLANPHLPWSNAYLFYEAHLKMPGLNGYGATLVGFPVMGIAFNDFLGWTHTVNNMDGSDVVGVEADGSGYRLNGRWSDIKPTRVTLRVKQNDGSMRSDDLETLTSEFGPLRRVSDGRFALTRIAGLDQAGLCEQWWEMLRARTFKQFEVAIRRLQVPMFTIIYADKSGHIFYLYNGQIPVRKSPSELFKSSDVNNANSGWTSTHEYSALPRLLDPKTGWLQNANDSPWLATLPPPEFKSTLSTRDVPHFSTFRSLQSLNLISNGGRQISFEEMVTAKHSTSVEAAARLLPGLLESASAMGDSEIGEVTRVLQKWDRTTSAESRGAVLFSIFVEEYARAKQGKADYKFPWNVEHALTTPNGLQDVAAIRLAILNAAAIVKRKYGRLDVPWGEVYRLRRGNLDLPASGGSGLLGVFRSIDFTTANDGKQVAVSGDSFVLAVQFSKPIRASVLLTYGNSSKPDSPHYTDQLTLFSQSKLRPVWRERSEIESHLEFRKILEAPQRAPTVR